jgi:hypothetical protein
MEEKLYRRIKKKREIWKPVKGFENLYEVSNTGRVYSKIKKIVLEPSILMPSLKWRAVSRNRSTKPYFEVLLRKDGKQKHCLVHRLVAEAFLENPENKPFVNHLNEVTVDNRVQNLEWCTPKENVEHSQRLRKMEEMKIEKITGKTKHGQLLLRLE